MNETPPPTLREEGAPDPNQEPVWTFRGYKMRPSEFNTAMTHYYRAEIQRSNVWRSRLDMTTNWAVVSVAAAVTFVFAAPENHWSVFLLVMLLTTLFLFIEARRYRYYELWSLRARLMETDFFAAMLVPPFAPHAEWSETLAETLLQPEFPISRLEAIGRRLRNNYLAIYFILSFAILMKLYLHPTEAQSIAELVSRADIGLVPGAVVLTLGAVFLLVLGFISFVTRDLHEASGEVVPKYDVEDFLGNLWPAADDKRTSIAKAASSRLAVRKRRRQQVMALVVAADPEKIAGRVIQEMHRGATALHGRGMYKQQEREVLLIALTVTEIEQLKTIVHEEDPRAFITVIPANEIVGQGFMPLKEEE